MIFFTGAMEKDPGFQGWVEPGWTHSPLVPGTTGGPGAIVGASKAQLKGLQTECQLGCIPGLQTGWPPWAY